MVRDWFAPLVPKSSSASSFPLGTVGTLGTRPAEPQKSAIPGRLADVPKGETGLGTLGTGGAEGGPARSVVPNVPNRDPGLGTSSGAGKTADFCGFSRGVPNVPNVPTISDLVRRVCLAAGTRTDDAYVADLVRRAHLAAAPDEDGAAERLALQQEGFHAH